MYSKTLNAPRSKAVTYTDELLLILVRPGSGKTLTTLKKVINFIDGGILSERILAV